MRAATTIHKSRVCGHVCIYVRVCMCVYVAGVASRQHLAQSIYDRSLKCCALFSVSTVSSIASPGRSSSVHLLIRAMTRHFHVELCLGTTQNGEREFLLHLTAATLCSSHCRCPLPLARCRLSFKLRHCFACQPSCRSMFLCLRHPHASMGCAQVAAGGGQGGRKGGMRQIHFELIKAHSDFGFS